MLDILLAHPSTAKFISTKMIRWLLQYDPPAALVDRSQRRYTQTGGDIPSMIRDDPDAARTCWPRRRSTVSRISSSLRRCARRSRRHSVTSSRPVTQLRTLGQPLFHWEDPDGYPDNVDYWAGTILPRWNFCELPAHEPATGNVLVDVAPLMTRRHAGRRSPTRSTGAPSPARCPPTLQAAAASRTSPRRPSTTTRVREAFALALSSNAFQWY